MKLDKSKSVHKNHDVQCHMMTCALTFKKHQHQKQKNFLITNSVFSF